MITSFVAGLNTVFLSAVPIVLLAFVLTWFLQEITLRGHTDSAEERTEPAEAGEPAEAAEAPDRTEAAGSD